MINEPNLLDWINTLSTAAGSLAIIVGLFGANSTIKANRRSAQQIKRSEVAENMIAISLSVEDAFIHIRSPFTSIPKSKRFDEKYPYHVRDKRIKEYNDLFRKLRHAQIKVRTILDIKEVDEAVDSLFEARGDINYALGTMLTVYLNKGSLVPRDLEGEKKWDLYIFESSPEEDKIRSKIESAIKTIEKHLAPIARLNL